MNSEMLARFSLDALRWIAEPALRGMIIAGAVAGLLWIFRVRGASAKIVAWTVVLCSALTLPAVTWLLPPLPVRFPAQRQPAYLRPMPQTSASRALANTAIARPAISPAGAASVYLYVSKSSRAMEIGIPSTARPSPIPWPVFALAAYLCTLVVLVVRLCVGFMLTSRMLRRAVAVDDIRAQRLVERCTHQMPYGRKPRLLESCAVNVPLTVGILHPAVVIPCGWQKWEEAKLAAVIAHELSHAKRRDPLLRTLAAVYRSIFWFSPLGWWLECHLAELGEQASDQAAISAGTEPTYYAELLMSFFRTIQSGQGRMNWQAVPMAAGNRAVDRIERVLSAKMLQDSGLTKSRLMLLFAGALPLICLIAIARPKFVMAASQQAPTAQPSPSALPPPAAPMAQASAAPARAVRVSPPAPTEIVHPDRVQGTIDGTVSGPVMRPVPSLLATPPTPPVELQANAADNATYRSSSFNGGMDFALVSGGSVTMNGSDDDRQAVESQRKKMPGDFIWFIHSGNAYVIRDPATVQAAKQLYAPIDDSKQREEIDQQRKVLDAQRADLDKQREELDKQREEFDRQRQAIRVDVPADLAQHLQDVEQKIKALGGSANVEELGRLQAQLGDLQGQLGSLRGKAGEALGKLGQQQGALGEKQGELGRRMGELGREQGELGRRLGELRQEQAIIAETAALQMQAIISKSLSNGTAKRVE